MKCNAVASGMVDKSWPRWRIATALSMVLVLLAGAMGCSQAETPETAELLPPPTKVLYDPPLANDPVEPFKIIGNIYYIGQTNYSAYLITTPEGHILLDTMVEETVQEQRANIEKLGFNVEDIKIILQAHAHRDHVGGLALFKEMTGAEILVMAEDAEVLADGGVSDFRGDGSVIWTPIRADRLLRDGEEVTLGGVTMTAHRTAGHSKGCTAWSWTVEENGAAYDVLFFCSNRVNRAVPMIDNPDYPTLAQDFAAGFAQLKTLPCDVFLASHGFMFYMEEKLAAREQTPDTNPFIDPEGCRTYITDWEYEFQYLLQQSRLGLPLQ